MNHPDTVYRLVLRSGVVYELAENGAVLDRSDGPKGWDYSGKWLVTGFTKRWNSGWQHRVTLAEAANGADIGHGWVHDLDHGTHRMWAHPTDRRVRRIERVA